MNDFKKEELQYMLEMVDSIKIVNRTVHDDEIQEKLQSMIDNYCEHEKVVPNYDCKTQCQKCGEII